MTVESPPGRRSGDRRRASAQQKHLRIDGYGVYKRVLRAISKAAVVNVRLDVRVASVTVAGVVLGVRADAPPWRPRVWGQSQRP